MHNITDRFVVFNTSLMPSRLSQVIFCICLKLYPCYTAMFVTNQQYLQQQWQMHFRKPCISVCKSYKWMHKVSRLNKSEIFSTGSVVATKQVTVLSHFVTVVSCFITVVHSTFQLLLKRKSTSWRWLTFSLHMMPRRKQHTQRRQSNMGWESNMSELSASIKSVLSLLKIYTILSSSFSRQGLRSQRSTPSNTQSGFMISSPPFCPNCCLRLEWGGVTGGHIWAHILGEVLLWVTDPVSLSHLSQDHVWDQSRSFFFLQYVYFFSSVGFFGRFMAPCG